MTYQIRRKNAQVLNLEGRIEFLSLLKIKKRPDGTPDLNYIAKYFEITLRATQYQRRRMNAYSDRQIDKLLIEYRRKVKPEQLSFERDFKEQEKCKEQGHPHAKMLLSCPCTLVLGEQSEEGLRRIIQIAEAHLAKFPKKLIEIKL